MARHLAKPQRRPRSHVSLRRLVQGAFASLCLWIGVEFVIFVRCLESGGAGDPPLRPPGVEGFLPISSLMSLYHFVRSGEIHPVHPAGLFILIAILAISILFGKAFCSWLCPFGLLSEYLARLGRKIFGRSIDLPRWLDYPLRGLKYLLLAFFVWAIFVAMSPAALLQFLDSPYNQVADIKMYYFFARISSLAAAVIGVLLLLSIAIRGSWCRYLCPYGGLLGLLSLLSPHKIRRDAELCVDCDACTRACPARIEVARRLTVVSDECSTCLACVDACPVSRALELRLVGSRRTVSKKAVAAAAILVFVAVTGLAMITGHWQNAITSEQYLDHVKYLETYGHPRGAAEIDAMNERTAGGQEGPRGSS
ncbi:MAG: 4Fe-4S binding protein [Planctomycetota bacterium]